MFLYTISWSTHSIFKILLNAREVIIRIPIGAVAVRFTLSDASFICACQSLGRACRRRLVKARLAKIPNTYRRKVGTLIFDNSRVYVGKLICPIASVITPPIVALVSNAFPLWSA